MDIIYKRSYVKILFITLAAVFAVSPAMAIPPDPDNAALLYYQAFLTLAQLDEDARDRISHVATGEAVPDDKVRTDIGNCRGAIDFAEAAAKVPTCNWGIRYSQGFDALMPQLAQARFLAFVLIADARISAADGNYKGAIERCLMAGTFARHIGDDTLISYLVSTAVQGLRDKCIQETIGQAAGDADLLQWLKNELAASPGDALSAAEPLKIEIETVTGLMQMDNIEKLAGILADSDAKKIAEIVKQADAKTLAQARQMYTERMNSGYAILNTPMEYQEAHSQLKKLVSDLDPAQPASGAVRAFIPALDSILSAKMRADAHANAVKAAIEVMLGRAKTGRLPDAIAAGLPKDPFSGKDFEYEKTGEGFILRCRGKDLNRDEIHQYEFKVKK